MKTTKTMNWMAVGLAFVMATTVVRASAGPPPTKVKPDRTYTAMVKSVDSMEQTLTAKGFFFSKKFNLGAGCVYTLLNTYPGNASDLRKGEKVKVSYQDVHGVLIADRIEQEPVRFEGTVVGINPTGRTMTVRIHHLDKTFQLPIDCYVVLRNERPGNLSDIQAGNHVTVTYEMPDNIPTARQIAQTSRTFTGKLTAIDLGARTVKAEKFLTTKKFNLADHCAIVINGNVNAKLDDLKPDERLAFSYDQINGVNVATRIGTIPAAGNQPAQTIATTSRMTHPPGF